MNNSTKYLALIPLILIGCRATPLRIEPESSARLSQSPSSNHDLAQRAYRAKYEIEGKDGRKWVFIDNDPSTPKTYDELIINGKTIDLSNLGRSERREANKLYRKVSSVFKDERSAFGL